MINRISVITQTGRDPSGNEVSSSVVNPLDVVRSHTGYSYMGTSLLMPAGPLGRELMENSIPTMPARIIESYKMEKARHLAPGVFSRRASRSNHAWIQAAMAIYVIALVSMILRLLLSGEDMALSSAASKEFMLGVAIITGVILGWIVICTWAGRKGQRTVDWIRRPLDKEYKRNIPVQVIGLIAEICQFAPDAHFILEDLEVGNRHRPREVSVEDTILYVAREKEIIGLVRWGRD